MRAKIVWWLLLTSFQCIFQEWTTVCKVHFSKDFLDARDLRDLRRFIINFSLICSVGPARLLYIFEGLKKCNKKPRIAMYDLMDKMYNMRQNKI